MRSKATFRTRTGDLSFTNTQDNSDPAPESKNIAGRATPAQHSAELERVIERWDTLPDPIRRAVLALIEA